MYIHRGVVDRRGYEHWTEVRERRTLIINVGSGGLGAPPASGPDPPRPRAPGLGLSAAARVPPNEIPSCRAGLTMPRKGAGRAMGDSTGPSYAHGWISFFYSNSVVSFPEATTDRVSATTDTTECAKQTGFRSVDTESSRTSARGGGAVGRCARLADGQGEGGRDVRGGGNQR